MRVSIATTIVLILAVVHTDAFDIDKTQSQLATMQQYIFQKIMEIGNHLVSNQNGICKGKDCPKYEVKKTTDDYELRCYKTYKWAATVTKGHRPWDYIVLEERLSRYINGENDKKEKMKLTAPLATKCKNAKDKSKSRYTMHYFIPFANQKTPPKPTDSDVSIVTFTPMCVYVRSYDGYFYEAEKNVEKLKEALVKDRVTDYIDPEQEFFYATYNYDKPWKQWCRHNEIWIRQKPTQSTQ